MITALIIDDEYNSRSALKNKLSRYCPTVQIIGEAADGDEGIVLIEKLRPDIVLLDVEMPRMNGFTMLSHLKQRNFEVIFITAYNHYAISAIKFSALDYLVKPVAVSELTAAIQRAAAQRTRTKKNEQVELLLQNMLQDNKEALRIAVPSTEGLQFIDTASILYLEAHSNYTQFFLKEQKKITVSRTLKEFEELLPEEIFIRIHHSHIINKNFVEKYIRGEGGQVLMANGVLLDVSKRKKNDFLRTIGR